MKLTELLDIESNLEESADGSLRMKIPFLVADKPTETSGPIPSAWSRRPSLS